MERWREWIVWPRKIAPEHHALLLLCVMAVALWVWAFAILPRPLEVTAFAVGKGDAFLIRSPTGRCVLIDGGSSNVPDVGERLLTPNLRLQRVRRLDAVIISHPDSDHLNGLAAVLEALPVGMLLDPHIADDQGTAYQQVCATADRRGVPRHRVRAGACLDLGDGVTLRILAPGATLLGGTGADDNNNSVVCRLEYRRRSMLFTGDLEMRGEQALLAQGGNLQADILKVAHHGSRGSTGDDWLAAVTPTRAVISCPGGEHNASHPHAETLARLQTRGIHVFRTDVHGQLRLTTDGGDWQVTTFRRPAAR